jgi:predicted nucleic acid-binding Zn ribbon protein
VSPRREDHGPRPLGSSLNRVSTDLGLGTSVGIGLLFSRWAEIVGPAVAAHVRPVRLDDAALVVTVDHPAWATQVRHLGDDLLDRVAEATGAPRPARLEVRVHRVAGGSGG